ncbi:MAG TPA: hypothetical protein VNO50_18090 [Pyrinomonadaceae bacterium]|nr:hypothetical protein [Pyrinomonadaceae bacterium]
MKRIELLIALLAFCIAASGCTRPSVEPNNNQGSTNQAQLSPDQWTQTRRTIVTYLECEECEEGELEAVVKLGESAVPTLAATLLEGPSPANREILRRQLLDTYRKLKEYEKTHPKAKTSQGEEEYVKTYAENYVALYQTRAARALGAIGGPNARKALEEASKLSLREDVKTEVKAALEKIK